MDLFEFVVSFFVVIAGLGVTLLVRSVGQMIESRRRVRFYWVHSFWLGFVFLLHVNSWFTLWAYRDLQSWTIGQLLLLISVPTLLYLASHVSVPEILENSSVQHDMRTYYYERHRLLLGLLGLAVLFTLASEYLLLTNRFLTISNSLRLPGLALLVLGTISSHPKVHAAITLVALAILMFGIAFVGKPIAT